MKTYFSTALALLIFLSSCNNSDNKLEKLKALKKKQEKLAIQIKELEAEIGKKGGTSNEILVKYMEVKPSEFNHFIKVQGRVDGEENVAANSKTVGVVTKILVHTGDRVSKGQVLAQLDDEVLQKSLVEIKTQYDFATNVYEKQKKLWEQKIGSEIQYLTAKNNKEAMENRLKALKEQIDMYKITSPINGTVEDIAIKVGQAVSPGAPLIRIINLSRLKVVADVSESYAARIKKGDVVQLEFPDISYSTTGVVSFSSKFINPLNRTFTVEIYLDQKEVEYRANMVAVLNINDYKAEKAFVLPVSIIKNDSRGKYIFVAEPQNDKLISVKRYITTGRSYGGQIEVLNGLNENEKIITSGLQGLEEGTYVKFM